MADPGDNGDGEQSAAVDVEVQVVPPAEEGGEAKDLLDEVLIETLRKAKVILAEEDLPKEDFYQIAKIVARLAPMALPKLSSSHNVNDTTEKIFERMRNTFSQDDCRKAIHSRQERLRLLQRAANPRMTPGRPGRPKKVKRNGS